VTMSLPVAVVTGVSSFVGMHLARCFSACGFRVVATTSQPRQRYTGIRERRLAVLDESVEFVTIDLRDAGAVASLVDRMTPSLWLHHAGFAQSYASFDFDFDAGLATNVAPLGHLYQALAGGGCGVVITGSSAEYTLSESANCEDDVCWPNTPYGLTKLAETLRARQLAERLGVPTRVARLYIPFGSLDTPEKLLSQVVVSLRAGKTVDLSPCTQARDFLGITDLTSAYVAMVKDLPRIGFDVFNICGGQPVLLHAFLQTIAERLKADRSLLLFGARVMRPGEALVSFGSNEKARRILGWAPSDLAVAIERDLLNADAG